MHHPVQDMHWARGNGCSSPDASACISVQSPVSLRESAPHLREPPELGVSLAGSVPGLYARKASRHGPSPCVSDSIERRFARWRRRDIAHAYRRGPDRARHRQTL